MNPNEPFKVYPYHIKLLREMEFEYLNLGDLVSIGVDGKRPFGNSDWRMDMAEILGWPLTDGELTDGQRATADQIMLELAQAVNTIIASVTVDEPSAE